MNEKPPSASRSAEQFVVRLPDGMRDKIAQAAKSNNRSMNAEIVSLLQGDVDNASTKSALVEVIARLNLELARAEASTQNARREKGLLEEKLRAAVYLLGQTQFKHDPEYEILAAQSHESMLERQAHDDWSGDFAKAHKKLESAEQEWDRVTRARAAENL